MSFPYLLFIGLTLILYLFALIILISTVKFKNIVFVIREDGTYTQLLRFRIILLLFSIISVSILFGTYQNNSPFYPEVSIFTILIKSIIFGAILFFILSFILKFFITHFIIHESKKGFYLFRITKTIFIILILTITAFHTTEAYIMVNNDNHQVLKQYGFAFSYDSSELSYLEQYSGNTYLIIQDLNSSTSKLFELCSTPATNNQGLCYYINEYPGFIKFYNESLIFIVSELDPSGLYLFVYNLYSKLIVDSFNIEFNFFSWYQEMEFFEHSFIRVNSTLMFASFNQIEANHTSIHLMDYFSNLQFDIILNQSINSPIIDYFLSSDLSILAIYCGTFINFYKITNHTANLASNIGLDYISSLNNYFSISQSINDPQVICYSYFTNIYDKTLVMMYNFTNSQSKQILMLSDSAILISVNSQKWLFTMYNIYQINTIQESNPSYTRKAISYGFISNHQNTLFVIYNENMYYLSSYNTQTDSFDQLKIFDIDRPSYLLNTLNFIQKILYIFLMVFIVITGWFGYVSFKKRNLSNDFTINSSNSL